MRSASGWRSNGGEEWSPQSSGTTGTLYSAYFFDAQRGFVVGPSNHVLQTSDGGATWARVQPGFFGSLYDITFADALNGWAVLQGGIILRTIDGGTSGAGKDRGVDMGYAETRFCVSSGVRDLRSRVTDPVAPAHSAPVTPVAGSSDVE